MNIIMKIQYHRPQNEQKNVCMCVGGGDALLGDQFLVVHFVKAIFLINIVWYKYPCELSVK